MGDRNAICYTAAELAARGKNDIPPELVSGAHLIYNSPASLSFNSPGAEGYGVKRAGLSVPDSVMLLVAPGCCGRNTSLISAMPAATIGGVSLILYGMISAIGVRNVVENKVDFTKSRNLIIAAVSPAWTRFWAPIWNGSAAGPRRKPACASGPVICTR